MFKTNLVLGMMLIMLLAMSTSLMAATYMVTDNGDSGAGTLRQAIIDAGDGDEITFNLSSGNETIVITEDLDITESLTINGSNTAGSGTAVTVQVTTPGTSTWRVFDITASGKTINISNMTIKGGNLIGSTSGGGILFGANASLNLNYVNVSGSKGWNGGGIYAYTSNTLNLSYCSIYGNTASGVNNSGGGLRLYECNSCTIENCTIYNNSQHNNCEQFDQ